MKRIGTVIVLAIFVVIAKFGGLFSFSWGELRILGEMSMIWLIYSLVTNPVTQFIDRPLPSTHLKKMIAIRHSRNSSRPLRFHLRSGEMREGFVVSYSFSLGSFAVTEEFDQNCHSPQKFYDINDIDELIVTPYNGQELSLENPIAEGTT